MTLFPFCVPNILLSLTYTKVSLLHVFTKIVKWVVYFLLNLVSLWFRPLYYVIIYVQALILVFTTNCVCVSFLPFIALKFAKHFLGIKDFPFLSIHHVSCSSDKWILGTESRRTQMSKPWIYKWSVKRMLLSNQRLVNFTYKKE